MLPGVDHLALKASPESERGKQEAIIAERVKGREPPAEVDSELFGLSDFADQCLFVAKQRQAGGVK